MQYRKEMVSTIRVGREQKGKSKQDRYSVWPALWSRDPDPFGFEFICLNGAGAGSENVLSDPVPLQIWLQIQHYCDNNTYLPLEEISYASYLCKII